ncbi:MAG: hypothetical protein QM645_11890 [Asticcacaulis sp.]
MNGGVVAVSTFILASALVAGQTRADDDKPYWDYDGAHRGVLSYQVGSSKYPRPRLSLYCAEDGSLHVYAPTITLWSDVGGPIIDPHYLNRIAIETSILRLEAPLETQGNGYVGWASGYFKDGVSLVAGIVGSEFLVVRAMNSQPVLERPLHQGDMAVSVEPPDWEKSRPFLAYCATISPPDPEF